MVTEPLSQDLCDGIFAKCEERAEVRDGIGGGGRGRDGMRRRRVGGMPGKQGAPPPIKAWDGPQSYGERQTGPFEILLSALIFLLSSTPLSSSLPSFSLPPPTAQPILQQRVHDRVLTSLIGSFALCTHACSKTISGTLLSPCLTQIPQIRTSHSRRKAGQDTVGPIHTSPRPRRTLPPRRPSTTCPAADPAQAVQVLAQLMA